ncbi:hypothetical protein Gotri_007690 [Gossypium trilobum]|uniref:SAP domain-containing protein n=1 Tax=Gossypium trilobum TaxID=34281 RepID=A0A7J9EHD6_9ROSI|nr:hypothetical protein [Gossypium trilobum]
MSSKHEILDNRPIDRWKVIELKEELKRRKLTTRGLKKDLVKRLDEAIRAERENNTANEADNGFNYDEGVEKAMPSIVEKVEDDGGSGLKLKDDVIDCATASGHGVVKTEITLTHTVVTEVPEVGQNLQIPKLEENVNSNIQVENDGPKLEVERDDPKAQLGNEDGMRASSALNNQVSEINTISTDSMSVNEKIELKDTVIDDNVKQSLDVVPMDDEQPLENKASVDERDDKNDTTTDISCKNDSGEMGYSGKLNLDRSSGDESMEEDKLETKQIDPKCTSDEIGENSVENEEGMPVVLGDGSSTDRKDVFDVPAEKRKLYDDDAIGNTEATKRHKWNSDNLQVVVQQATNHTVTNNTSEDTPGERLVPPSQKPPTTSLRVDNFLRPFTLKAVRQLLGKTGIIASFWMDHIKTHCYVTYLSVEEAIETRNAIYNLQWPPNGGRLLVAEFVDPHEVENRVESPPPTTTVTDNCGFTAHQQQVSEQQPLSPPPPEEPDSPMLTLDDLFRKTKATPKIYYLPLSEEQVAAKQATHYRHTKHW